MGKTSRNAKSLITLEELAARYCSYHFSLSVGSKYLLRRAVASFETSLTKNQPATLKSLTDEQVCSWLSSRSKLASKQTVKRERGDLLRMWRWAAKQGWCRPPGEIPSVKLARTVPRAWSANQIALCIRICSEMRGTISGTKIPLSEWWIALLLFIFDTGSRIGAALSVDLTTELCLDRCCVVLSELSAKTDSEQILCLSLQTCKAIQRLLHKIQECSVGRATGKLFPWVTDRSRVFAGFRKIRAEAGFPKRREGFHRIRKSHATYITAACGIETASRQMGHTTTAMTLAKYVDPILLSEKIGRAHV